MEFLRLRRRGRDRRRELLGPCHRSGDGDLQFRDEPADPLDQPGCPGDSTTRQVGLPDPRGACLSRDERAGENEHSNSTFSSIWHEALLVEEKRLTSVSLGHSGGGAKTSPGTRSRWFRYFLTCSMWPRVSLRCAAHSPRYAAAVMAPVSSFASRKNANSSPQVASTSA